VILRIDPERPDPSIIERAAEALSGSRVVVAPTETRYGLLCRADRQGVIEKLYRLKNRDLNRPTALIVPDLEAIEQLGRLTPAARLLAEQYLPGPLTLVLAAAKAWPPPRVVEGRIGCRWSPAATIKAILAIIDFPLTATSANISGQCDAEVVQDIEAGFGDNVELYLDAGPLTGPTSTVVDCSGDGAVILREGAIAADAIRAAVAEL
jgi:L-threonylcarbamoyladenylate synthase